MSCCPDLAVKLFYGTGFSLKLRKRIVPQYLREKGSKDGEVVKRRGELV